jgi:uncharacterized protein
LRAEQGQLPELKRVIALYGDRVVMKETLAEALSALFMEPGATPERPDIGAGASARPDWARDALDHYRRAIERLKSGDWAGFGAEIGGLLQSMSRESEGR